MPSESLLGELGLHPRVYERIVRIVSLSFVAAVALAVTLGDLWPTTRAAIYVVLAVMTLFVVLVQDVIPPQILGRRRFAVEAVAGIGFITVLAMLTGGSSSPFFFGYFLIVAGAALWITGTAPILLAVLTALVYLVGIALTSPVGPTGSVLPMVAFNLLGLGLMAYLATVAGREQRRINDRAIRLSRYDSLTELYYRAYFLELLAREIQRASRTGRPFCLLMLDLDGLKPINDTFGHPLGDGMLRAVADVIRRDIRASDSAARYGGDEFIVLLPETDPQGAVVLAEKLRADIAHINIRLPDRSISTSVSIGLAGYPADGDTSDRLIRVVDQAMYEAKRLGKNRIAYPAHGGSDPGTGAQGHPADAATPRTVDSPSGASAPVVPTELGPRSDGNVRPGVPVMAPQSTPRPPAPPGAAPREERRGSPPVTGVSRPGGPGVSRPSSPGVSRSSGPGVDGAARLRPGPQAGPRPPAERLAAAHPARPVPAGLTRPARAGMAGAPTEQPVASVYGTADNPSGERLRPLGLRSDQAGAPQPPGSTASPGVASPSASATAGPPTVRPEVVAPPPGMPATAAASRHRSLASVPPGTVPSPLHGAPTNGNPGRVAVPTVSALIGTPVGPNGPGRPAVAVAMPPSAVTSAASSPARATVALFGPAGSPGSAMRDVSPSVRPRRVPRAPRSAQASPEEATWADLPEADGTSTARHRV